jgi:hypothetical protein
MILFVLRNNSESPACLLVLLLNPCVAPGAAGAQGAQCGLTELISDQRVEKSNHAVGSPKDLAYWLPWATMIADTESFVVKFENVPVSSQMGA